MQTDLLSELKKLQYQRSDSSPFASHVEFQAWADKVIPLLSFNPKFQSDFRNRVISADCANALAISGDEISNINSAIGIVNQAITSLELMPIQSSAASPSKHPSDKGVNLMSMLHIDIFKTVAGGLVLACVLYLIATYVGLNLNG